jgi:hypothetical protein
MELLFTSSPPGRVKAAAKGSPDTKQRKQRKKKDKNAPKRPCTAFFYYVLAQRAAGEHEGMKVRGPVSSGFIFISQKFLL